MGMFDWMLKEEARNKKTTTTPSTQIAPKTITTPAPIVVNSTLSKGKGDYKKHFQLVLKNANVEGPDYHEFAAALSNLEGEAIAEDRKYKNTFAAFQTMGVTVDKLVNTGEKYITVCIDENNKFGKKIDGDLTTNVANKRSRAQAYEREIEEMLKAIEEKKKLANQLYNEADASEQEINADRNAFNYEFENTVAIIRNNLTNIKTYLNANITK